jgi:hypothetical protein
LAHEYLRRIPGDIAAGFRAVLDLLLWGHVYPRTDPALTARLLAAQRCTGGSA